MGGDRNYYSSGVVLHVAEYVYTCLRPDTYTITLCNSRSLADSYRLGTCIIILSHLMGTIIPVLVLSIHNDLTLSAPQ